MSTSTKVRFPVCLILGTKSFSFIASFYTEWSKEIRRARFSFRYISSEHDPVDAAARGLSPKNSKITNYGGKDQMVEAGHNGNLNP